MWTNSNEVDRSELQAGRQIIEQNETERNNRLSYSVDGACKTKTKTI